MFTPRVPLVGHRRRSGSRVVHRDPRRARRFTPGHESLEWRITPTGNIAITDILIVNSNDTALTTISVGEQVYVKVDFTTANLPTNASYRIAFNVNGLTLSDKTVTAGAGDTSANWNYDWGTFDAMPGKNDFTVILDADDSVAETSYADNSLTSTFQAATPAVGDTYFSAAEIRSAYGIDSIPAFGSTPADGAGQTIGIVDAGNDPNIITDLEGFDEAMTTTLIGTSPTYAQQYGPATSILSVYNESGQNITADIGTSGSNGVPPDLGWAGEITLDVEWAHAIAPGAKIDLIEASASTRDDLLACNAAGGNLPGVTVVSNSWDWTEASDETSYDTSTLVTPTGHPGVTFLVSSGDAGDSPFYPSCSPNAIAVGGTQLTLSNDGYGGEIGWSFPTPRTLNDGSSSYSQTGSWNSNSGGFSGTYGTASGGSSASATWTTPITSSDQGWLNNVEVSATWTAAAGNASNATYTIYDGSPSADKVLGTVAVNQAIAPIGTADGSTNFQELGVYDPSSGSVTVVLNAGSANGKVVADAVGIAQGWSSTGGKSQYEAEPAAQESVQQTGKRETPDVSFNGSINSGNNGYESGIGGTSNFFGTSLACPCWAGLIAIADQGRVAAGGTTLNSPTDPGQAVAAIYSLPSGDYHDITIGYNGTEAGTGYDEVTGRGSPIANVLVPDLVNYQLASNLVVSTEPPATITAGTPFSLTVTVDNAAGGVNTSYSGPVTISLASNPGNGTLGGTLTVSAAEGVATFSGLTLDVADAGYQIQATASNASTAYSTGFTVTPAAATEMVISSEPPSSITAGLGFGLAVVAEDTYGNIATTADGSVTVVLDGGPAGAKLGGTLTESMTDGVATFTFLNVTKAGSGYSLGVSSLGLSGATSSTFAVTPAAPAKLVVLTEPPSSVKAGASFGLVVDVEDTYGNVVTTNSATVVALTLASGPGTLFGTLTATDSDGVATFTNLADDSAGSIALKLTASGLTSGSTTSVVVTPASPTKLVIQAQPSANASAGIPFASQPVIDEQDQYGNLETTDSTTAITVTQATGSGPLIGSTKVVVVAGVAKFGGLGDSRVETTTLKFAGGSLTTATSNAINVAKPAAILSWTPSKATGIDHQSITLTATVAAPSGLATPTGTVTFLDGATVLGSSPIVNGRATLTTSALRLGTQSISLTYAGDSTYAAGTSPATPIYVGDLAKLDFDGDGKADIAIFDPVTATFAIQYSGGGSRAQQLGNPGDVNIPVFGDYDGDGKTDVGLYDQTAATFLVLESGGGSINIQLGNPHDVNVPVVGDFTGSGKTNLAIFDKTTATFYVLESGKVVTQQLGNPKDVNIPVAGDYDGDGKTDFAVFDQTQATFLMLYSGGGSRVQQLGNPHDVNIPIAGDFDGDGKTDIAVYDQTQATFLILESGGGTIVQQLGIPGDANVPVSGDFDGDGKTDIAVYDQSAGTFLILDSGGGSLVEAYGNPKHKNIPG